MKTTSVLHRQARGAGCGRAGQRGALALIVVMLLLIVSLLGGYAFARVAEGGTLVAGGMALRERAQQASEVGANTAFDALRALPNEDNNTAWYQATARAAGEDGLPTGIDWSRMPALEVGAFEVRYFAERLCTQTPADDPQRQCLLKQEAAMQSRKVGAAEYDMPTGRQFRITVRVTGPKSSASFVQALVTRG